MPRNRSTNSTKGRGVIRGYLKLNFALDRVYGHTIPSIKNIPNSCSATESASDRK